MQGQMFPQERFFDRIKRMFTSLVVMVMAGLKFAPLLLKTGGTMFISIFLYAQVWGWRYAVGFVLLLFVHETGHLLAARLMGIRVGLPVFIPFMGAVIALKEAPRNAWVEAVVGIGGPILGSAGALAVWGWYLHTGNMLFLALAYVGFFLNLFNLIPIVPLDGGRIVSAISPWLWLIGLALLVPVLFYFANVFVLIIFVLLLREAYPRVRALFRARTETEERYFECTRAQRWTISILYFVLLAGLGALTTHTHSILQALPGDL